MSELTHSPSIFELIACEGLKVGLREAFRFLLDSLRESESINRLPIPPTDETILLLDLIIEYNHLRTYRASYAENLYNLVRIASKSGEKDPSIYSSLVCLTLIPYLKRKLDKYFDDLYYKEIRTADELRQIRLYRLLTRSCSFLNLICLARFATGQSSYHNVIDGLLGIRLISRIEDRSEFSSLPFANKVSKIIADSLGRGLTIGSYFIQFLDYWDTHSNSAPLFNASLPTPDPPRKDDLAHTDDRSSNICLICLHVRQNECALSNTGYVFCYSCLQRYVTTKRRCPVTGQPTTLDNIVKLFTSTPS